MDIRDYLQKAQEAYLFADFVESPIGRRRWENVATEYRRKARKLAKQRHGVSPIDA
jgi:hypothetical protein